MKRRLVMMAAVVAGMMAGSAVRAGQREPHAPDRQVHRLQSGDRVVFCGDSITCLGYHNAFGFRHQITNALAHVTPAKNVRCVNLGFCGNGVKNNWLGIERDSRTRTVQADAHSRAYPEESVNAVFSNRVDVLVLCLGMNDILCPYFVDTPESFADWRKSYAELVRNLKARVRPRVTVLGTVPPLTNDPQGPKNVFSSRMDDEIRRIAADEGALVVDYKAALFRALGRIRRISPDYQDAPDFVHPRELGNIAMAAELCRTLGETAAADFLEAHFKARLAELVKPADKSISYRIFPLGLEDPDARERSYRIEWTRLADGRSGSTVVKTVPDRAVNAVTVEGERIDLPAPWRVSAPFTGEKSPSEIAQWRLTSGTFDYLGGVDSDSVDYMQAWFGETADSFYACRGVYSERDRDLPYEFRTAAFSNTYDFRVELNGALVSTNALLRGKTVAPGGVLRLKKGWNDLVIRCGHRQWQRQFAFRLLPTADDDLSDIRYSWSTRPRVPRPAPVGDFHAKERRAFTGIPAVTVSKSGERVISLRRSHDAVGGRCEVALDGARVTGWTAEDGTPVVASIVPAWPWFGTTGLPGARQDGFAAGRTFEVRSRTESSVTLGLRTDGTDDPDWDRAADCEIAVTLAADGLDVSLKTTNVGREPLLLTAGLRARLCALNRDGALLCGGEKRLPLTDAAERVLPDYSHVWRLVEPSSGRTVRVALRGNRGSVVRASVPEVCAAVHDRNDPVVLLPGETKILGMRFTLESEGPAYRPTPGPHDFAVYVPRGIPQDNEHFHVLEGAKGLLAFWTQGSWEGAPDMHVAFAKSSDGGRSWSTPRVLWGPSSADSGIPCAIHQVPLVSRSGKVYCLWAQEGQPGSLTSGRAMMAACSDDAGETWSDPVRLAEPRNWCVWQRPLRLATGGRHLTAISIAEEKVTKTKFLRFENIDEDPAPRDIRFTILGDGSLEGEEASIVKLPDGRLFAVMRSRYGTPLWTQSRDGGETWSPSRPLRDANGRPIRHPRAPCPMYDMEGPEAASGRYFALFTGTYDPELQQFFGRGPLYLHHGAFDAKGEQPVRFTKGRLLLTRGPDDRYGNSCYSSFTVHGDERVLWYPDAKYNLLGLRIAE